MPPEAKETFNQRLSQWVASQGFWFQIRYSMASGGSRNVVLLHLMKFGIRLLALAAILAVAGLVYLWRAPSSKSFQAKVQSAVNARLGAKETEIKGLKRVQGEILLRHLSSEGGGKTFFSNVEASNIKGRMSLLDSLPKQWNLGLVSIGSLSIQINAGADGGEESRSLGDIVFAPPGRVAFDSMDIFRATIRWGFSDRTRGSLVDTHAKIYRGKDHWRIEATGGWFSQNWLQNMEVVDLAVVVKRDTVEFEKANFRKGSGTVSMDGLTIATGPVPIVKGTVRLVSMPLGQILPANATDFIDGTLTADLEATGSTNTEAGISLAGMVSVDGHNPIILRDRIYLLKALSDFSAFHSFRSVRFDHGSFELKTGGGGMTVGSVDLRAPESPKSPDILLEMTGGMTLRLPTAEEAAKAVPRDLAGDPINTPGSSGMSAAGIATMGSDEITLKKAGASANKASEEQDGRGFVARVEDDSPVFNRNKMLFQTEAARDEALRVEAQTLIYEGMFHFSLPGDIFRELPDLRMLYPVDSETGRVPLDVPIKGDLYRLTFDQREQLYLRTKR